MDKAETLSTLENAYTAFRAKIAGLPDDAWAERWLGDWSLVELSAHMAGWWGEMAGALARVSRGERPAPEGVDYGDADRWNAGFAGEAPAGKAAALANFDARFREYAAAAGTLGDDLFGTNEQGRMKIGSRLLDGAGIHHLDEHGPQVDAWLAGRGGAR